ncbi:hypothetical protein M3Y98_00999300 [Aphelenchoides besseyi]|nr:hypothetical protein M3Y98_00999300 [Aphelenchoides besseyi]KAI6195139.1 hypothetical protein M3Y96_01199200 [Aphelenchoides besseyi]
MINWRYCSQVFEYGVASISISLNGILLYLCLYKISKSMKEYKCLLVCGCVIDLLFTISSAVCQIVIVDHETKMIFVLESPFLPATHRFVVIATSVYCLVLYAMIINVVTQFVNRLNIICLRNRFSIIHVFMFEFVFFCWTTAHCTNIGNVCDEHNNPATIRELEKNPFFHNSTVPPYIAGDTHKLKMIIQLIDSQFIITTAYGIIFYCGWRIQRKLSEDKGILLESTIRSQKRVSKILYVQAIIPIVSVIFPVGLADFLPLINLSFDYIPIFIRLTIGITPLLNPLVVLMVIPSFRNSVMNLIPLNLITTVQPASSELTSGQTVPPRGRLPPI